MKKIEVSIVKFEASDGKIFDTEEKAIFYEKKLNGIIRTCKECGGSGKCDMYGDGRVFVTCNICNGKGYVEKSTKWS
ncbi:hypothetical protein [Poseidonibacter sp.]|uniref:hypothetical protein n=1 Tax=Poseidonibacter sp. TaxID=2321188 RepID=UPI003C78C613